MKFLKLYQDRIVGALMGLDRMRFRGTDRLLSNTRGFTRALAYGGLLLKHFGEWAEETTKAIRGCCAEQAQRLDIPVVYLNRSGVDKEALAREVARTRGVGKDGSICMVSAVEGCIAPMVRGDRQSQRLQVELRPRKCVFVYYYFDDPVVGFGHVRLQSWAPYPVWICLNGRHWLEKQLLSEGIGYRKAGNCFTWVEDVEGAQALLDAQLRPNWPSLLDGLVDGMCPELKPLCAPFTLRHYWSAEETEYATDVMFRSPKDLDALFPALVLHGMRVSDCRAVLRYFGRRGEGAASGRVPDEVKSDCRVRHEAVRIKHWVNGDSVKMYNKERSVLRVETTINTARNFKAFRSANDDETKPARWQRMRKGTADLHRRCEVSRACNERYLDAMSALEVEKTLRQVAHHACNRTSFNGRSVRGLNPWNTQDFSLLMFLAKGEWALNGFRNKNLCAWLAPGYQTLAPAERKRLSARAGRLIGLLRAHGLVRKVARENRYVLSQTGRTFATAILVASTLEAKRLVTMAA